MKNVRRSSRDSIQKVLEAKHFMETISVASIKEDEEGTNLNAKGINTDYVKHYNSINKTREESKNGNNSNSAATILENKCYCHNDDDERASDVSSNFLETSMNGDLNRTSERKYVSYTRVTFRTHLTANWMKTRLTKV